MGLLFLSSTGLCLLISSLLCIFNEFPFSHFRQCSIELFRGDGQELRMEKVMCTETKTYENARYA